MRETLSAAVEECSLDVSRTEAVLDDVERGVRTCPHVFAAFDRDPAAYDARGMRDAASEAMVSLKLAQSALSDVFAGTGVSPTFDHVRTTFGSIAAILSGLPTDEDMDRHDVVLDALAAKEAELSAKERDLADVLGSPEVGTDAVTAAASGLHSLRAQFGMSSLSQAEGNLADLLAEQASLAALRRLWTAALDDVGLPDHFAVDKASFVLASEQVVWLGTETVLASRRLPPSGRDTLTSFAARCLSMRAERDALVSEYGPAWLEQGAPRIRRAADILAKAADSRMDLAVAFADGVGVRDDRASVLGRMASCAEAIVILDNDVQAARVLGGKFLGIETDVATEVEALERWFWLLDEAANGPEYAAVARAVTSRDPGEVLAFERRLSAMLEATAAHEATYGPDWYAHHVDVEFVADLTDHIAAIHAVGLRGDDAFDRVFKAFALTTKVERLRSDVTRLSNAATPRLDDVRFRLFNECRDFLERLFPEATFDDMVTDPVALHASAVVGREAVAAALAHVRHVNALADFPVIDINGTVAEAADRLPLLLDGVRISNARMAWTEAHDALDKARAILQGYESSLRSRAVPAPVDPRDRDEARSFVSEIARSPVPQLGCLQAVQRLAAEARTPVLVPLPVYKAPETTPYAAVVAARSATLTVVRSDSENAPARQITLPALAKPIAPVARLSGLGKGFAATKRVASFGSWGQSDRNSDKLIPDVAIADEHDVGSEWVEEHLRKVQDDSDRRLVSGA